MSQDIREVTSAYAPTSEQRAAIERLVPRMVPEAEVPDLTEMLLGRVT